VIFVLWVRVWLVEGRSGVGVGVEGEFHMPRKWIGKAIRKPGALRSYVKRKYGAKGFTKRGTIKVSILRDLANEPGKTGQRARLALRLRGYKKGK